MVEYLKLIVSFNLRAEMLTGIHALKVKPFKIEFIYDH